MRFRKAKKVSQEGGYCCPHCADSKYPCVRTELGMQEKSQRESEGRWSKKAERETDKEKR